MLEKGIYPMNFKFLPFVRIELLRSTKPTFFKEMFLKTEHRKEGKERRFPNWRNEKEKKRRRRKGSLSREK